MMCKAINEYEKAICRNGFTVVDKSVGKVVTVYTLKRKNVEIGIQIPSRDDFDVERIVNATEKLWWAKCEMEYETLKALNAKKPMGANILYEKDGAEECKLIMRPFCVNTTECDDMLNVNILNAVRKLMCDGYAVRTVEYMYD